jgi:hypothetical protein
MPSAASPEALRAQPQWLAVGAVYRGWARSALGDPTGGLAWIEDGIEDWRAPGSIRLMPFFLALKAEALHLADRTSESEPPPIWRTRNLKVK